jgi:hypothetical protein
MRPAESASFFWRNPSSGCPIVTLGAEVPFFGRLVSLVIATAAIVGVFTEIPILNEYAFWILVGAYFIWLAVHRLSKGFKPLLMASIALLLVAIVGVFIEIPMVSDYVFWVMEANYLMIVAATGSSYLIIVTK